MISTICYITVLLRCVLFSYTLLLLVISLLLFVILPYVMTAVVIGERGVVGLPTGAAAVVEDGPVVGRQKARQTNALEQRTSLPPGAEHLGVFSYTLFLLVLLQVLLVSKLLVLVL